MIQLHEPVETQPTAARTQQSCQWLVLWTKSRQEKELSRQLDARHVEHFLPLINQVSMTRGRKRVTEVPLFPGYVFLNGQIEDAYDAVASKRVCQVIRITDQQRFIHEIEQIRRALEGKVELQLHPFAVVGRRCRVKRGPLIGLEGVITERGRRDRLVLTVDVLGRGAALEIDADLLEPVD